MAYYLSAHNYTKSRGGGVVRTGFSYWCVHLYWTSVEPFVNKVMPSLVKHGRYVKIKQHEWIPIKDLISRNVFLISLAIWLTDSLMPLLREKYRYCFSCVSNYLHSKMEWKKTEIFLVWSGTECNAAEEMCVFFLQTVSVLDQLMNSAASKRKSNEFWSTCTLCQPPTCWFRDAAISFAK